jgi:Secretion system C-terminal sorting domain
MKTIYNLLGFIFLTFTTSFTQAQVTKVMYQLEYNYYDSTYTMYIKIKEGTATTAPHRAQFNSQINFVMPTGLGFHFQKMYMPLIGNNKYEGTRPIDWTISTYLKSPSMDPSSDFIAITPTLSPTAFYNDLKPEDEIKLFSFKLDNQPKSPVDVLLYKNTPGSYFNNYFNLGGIENDYIGTLPMRLINQSTVKAKDVIEDETTIYPNPTSQFCTIQTKEQIEYHQLKDTNGRLIQAGKSTEIDLSLLPNGAYYLIIITSSNKIVKKLIKI